MTPSPDNTAEITVRNRSGLPRSEVLLAITIIIGMLHHTDHVLRHDHSGWPFISEVTPFTFSLLVYPVLLSVYLARSWPWYRVAATASILVGIQAAHIWVETPRDQYHTWAVGVSDFPKSFGQPNLLHIASPAMGVVAVVVSILLSISLLLTVILFTQDAFNSKAKEATTGK